MAGSSSVFTQSCKGLGCGRAWRVHKHAVAPLLAPCPQRGRTPLDCAQRHPEAAQLLRDAAAQAAAEAAAQAAAEAAARAAAEAAARAQPADAAPSSAVGVRVVRAPAAAALFAVPPA